MKIPRSSFLHLIVPLALLASIPNVRGQVGNDNPTGPSGAFNGNVTTAGSYDPYTGNATRTIIDIAVAGAVGEYGLSYSRTWNTRSSDGWKNSYGWYIDDVYDLPDGEPIPYTVNFPDGRVETFTHDPGPDPYFRSVPGVRERLKPWDGTHCYLILPDGGKVKFEVTATSSYDAETQQTYWDFSFSYPLAIIDPYGLELTLAHNSDGTLSQVTEKAGRWIKVFYTTISGLKVVDYLQGSDGRVVDYTYETRTFGGAVAYTVLKNVYYYGDSSLTSTYTYRSPNVGSANGLPLLATCDDPMFTGGPMKKIHYDYAIGTNPDGSQAVHAQLKAEKNSIGTAVSSLSITGTNTRKETRADGRERTFTYTNGYLTSWTDFKNVASSQTYDSAKYVDSITDGRGNTTNFTNNPLNGVVTQVQYPATPGDTPPGTPRGTVIYTYGWAACPDPNNRDANNPYYLYSVTDEAGNVTKFWRDTNKRVIQIDYADGSYETFSYDSVYGQVLTHRMKTGGMESFTYDASRRLETYRNPDNATGNPTARYLYDALGRVSGVTDVLGATLGDVQHTTNYLYNSRGQVTVTTLPTDPIDGVRHTIVNAYNSNGDGTLVSVTDQLGHVTSYTYDEYRRRRSMTTPAHPGESWNARTTSFSYDANQGTGEDYTHTDSQVRRLTLPSGNIVKTTYDENFRRKSVTPSAGNGTEAATTSYDYDNEGNVTAVFLPDQQPSQSNYGKSTTTIYDQRNRPMSVTDALGNVTSFTYDAGGRRKAITQPNGQVTTYETYDVMNRVLEQKVTQATGVNAVTKFTYPSPLQMTMQDPRLVALGSSDKYTFEYDLMGRPKKLTYPQDQQGVSRFEMFVYDTAGRIQTYTNRAGQVRTFTHDALHRQTNFSWSAGAPNVAYSYDVANRMTSITSTAATISRTYFDDNLLKTETQSPAGGSANTVSYNYTPDGQLDRILYPWTKEYRYHYTGRNQIKQVQDYTTSVYQAEYDYDVNGNLKTRKVGNNLAIVSDWSQRTPLGSVTHVEDRLTGTTRTFDYKYDSMNDRFWAKRDGGTADTYGYDLAQQLTSSVLGGATTTLAYDANGNRTSVNGVGSPNFESNKLNQYSKYDNLAVGYDDNGNLKTYNNWTYTYDAQNRLTKVEQGTTTKATYAYDGLNRQIKQTIDGVNGGAPTYNVWAGWSLIEERGAGNSFLKGYLYGAGEIVKNWNGFNQQRLYFQDGSGSTSHLTDAAGNLLERYSYNGFGKPTFYDAGGTAISASGHGIRHLFQGQLWTQQTGLNDHRNRQAFPTMGVFMQPDPIGFAGDPSNLYRYCGNNAVNLSDPLGLDDVRVPQKRKDTSGVSGGEHDYYDGGEGGGAVDTHNWGGGGDVDANGEIDRVGVAPWGGGDHGSGEGFGGTGLGITGGRSDGGGSGGDRPGGGSRSRSVSRGPGNGSGTSEGNPYLNSNSMVAQMTRGFREYNLEAHAEFWEDYAQHVPEFLPVGTVARGGRGLFTASRYFRSKTASGAIEALTKKFGPPRSIRPGAQTFYNPRTGRSFNVHTDPAHGRPHVDIRRRGRYKERKYVLDE